MTTVVVREAEAQLREIAEWWTANRPAAPSLVVDEFERSVTLLENSPDIGTGFSQAARLSRRRARRITSPSKGSSAPAREPPPALHPPTSATGSSVVGGVSVVPGFGAAARPPARLGAKGSSSCCSEARPGPLMLHRGGVGVMV